jgi:hypothetical protein
LVNNILLFVAILIWIFILYNILSFFVNTTSQTENKKEAENTLIQIETLIRTAWENINNSEIFEKNITDAEVLVKQIREQNLYSKNLTDIINELNLLKRQFNKIEIFNESESNLVRALDENIWIKIVRNDSEIYVLDSKSVVWPILVTQKPGIYTFSNLWENETFVDWIFIGQNLYILTNNSKIIRFAGKWVFEYANVSWQDMWENIKQLWVYTNTNLYTLWTNNQIYRHTANWTNFNAWDTYLKVDDITQIGNILSIAIDWWFYILKEDLSMIKMIRDKDPYRLESLVLSNLPENYKNYIFKEWDKIELKAGTKLNYVYMLLDNKIFVFKPNTKVYTDTKNLTYIWQIEWATKTIKDFYVSHDWEEWVAEILVLNESGIYKLNFQVSDNKIMIR